MTEINKVRVCVLRSNPVAPDSRVEKTAHALSRAGYQVMIYAWDRSGSAALEETVHGVHVYRYRLPAPFGSGLRNLPKLFRWQFGLLRWLIKHRAEYDVIHACDFDTILPALWMKRHHRKKVIYDIFDFYADHLRLTPGWIKNNIRRVDLWAIGEADALILVDDARVKQVAGSKPRSTTIIYNSPEDVRDQLASNVHTPAGGLRLAYVGLLQIERGLLEMLSVLRNHRDWRLDLAGFGGDEDAVRTAATNMPNVHWHGRVNYHQALQLSAAADVLFATYDPVIPNHKYSSPNKVFEAMMLGKPIIVAAGTNMDRMIAEADCGCIVPYGDIPALEKTLHLLVNEPELLQKYGKNARIAYDTRYNWAIMSQRLIQLYEQVLQQ